MAMQPAVTQTHQSGSSLKKKKNSSNPQTANDTKAKQKMKFIFFKGSPYVKPFYNPLNLLSANPTNRLNTFKQFLGSCRCLSV